MTDINIIDVIDGLRRFQNEFERDFLFRDIGEMQDCLTRNEFVEIRSLLDEKDKIDKLFFTLIYIKKDPWPFLRHLKHSYQWLYEYIVNSRSDKWISDYRKAIHDVKINDWNIHRTRYLWEIQKHLKNLQRNHYLILFGKLGFGKRWLAVDACRDYGIISRMNFKIFWLNVSKCRTQELVLQKMHLLKVQLQADDLDIKYNMYSGNTKNEIIHMRNYLRKILEQPEFRNCLIVLTDVQDEQIIKAFDLKCKILITTRHIERLDEIPSSSKTTIDIDKGFAQSESFQLFEKALSMPLPDDMPTYIEKFHAICNGHPFIMSLIAKSFQQFSRDPRDRKSRCDNWLKNLNEYKLQDIDDQIKRSIEESLKFLSPDHQICYKKMVIFTDNSDIPFTVLEKLWDKDSQQTEEIVLKLSKYSLIEKSISDDTKGCSLHYLHMHVLKQQVKEDDKRKYHQHLIGQYEIEKVLRERKDLDLNFPNDKYFYYFIPYHFVEADMEHLFDLYFDFGFLEKKMRVTQLANTVGDMRMFENKITRNDPERKEFLNELIIFLTNNEQLIFKSQDVNLLQCGLTSFGLVKKRAQEQITYFKDRVWMDDVNHEENQTQIVQLPDPSQVPSLVRFVKPSDDLVCLIALQDNTIIMHDIQQDYFNHPVLYRNKLNHSLILDMQVFRNHAFLTLNNQGKLHVYTLKPNPTRKPSGPSKLYDSKDNKVLQCLDNTRENTTIDDKITCFTVLEQQEAVKLEIDLMIGTSKGDIKFYQWKIHKFEETSVKIKTKFDGLFKMARIQNYALLLNVHGAIKFIDLINSGQVVTDRPWQDLESPKNLHQGMCIHTKRSVSLCVSKDKVVQVTHSAKRTNFLLVEYDDVFVANDEFDNNQILSSTMSKDAEYLILGTTKGIIVIDRFHKKVIFRRNISDQVLSLDIYRYHDEAMYILSSVFKDAGPVINLYAFNGNRDDLAIMNSEMIIFVGEELFDVKKLDDAWHLIAIDTKRNIHYRSCSSEFLESYEKIAFQYQIKKICCQGDYTIVGCTNGEVLRTNEYNQVTSLATLMSEITYLECFDDFIIASCSASFKLIPSSLQSIEFYGKLAKAFRYKEDKLLLVKKNCAIEVLDTKSGKISWSKLLVDDDSCSAQAYRDGLVVITTSLNSLLIWQINEVLDATLEMKTVPLSSIVTSLAISYDKSVLAVGYQNGTIGIFDLINTTWLQKLESHKRAIMNLQFSPWTNANDPLILLSLSESAIFWNIRSIQNNPLELKKSESSGRLRVSQRFKSPMKLIPTIINTMLLSPDDLPLSPTTRNPWHGKTGSSDKPELLSCIKLVAKSAKRVIYNDDFTRFVTIDNEGNIYHLRLIDDASDCQLSVDYNGNPSALG